VTLERLELLGRQVPPFFPFLSHKNAASTPGIGKAARLSAKAVPRTSDNASAVPNRCMRNTGTFATYRPMISGMVALFLGDKSCSYKTHPSPTLMVRITTFLLEARSHCAGLLQYCDSTLNEPYAMSAGTVGNPISKNAPPSG
jgi:hypothetical protein